MCFIKRLLVNWRAFNFVISIAPYRIVGFDLSALGGYLTQPQPTPTYGGGMPPSVSIPSPLGSPHGSSCSGVGVGANHAAHHFQWGAQHHYVENQSGDKVPLTKNECARLVELVKDYDTKQGGDKRWTSTESKKKWVRYLFGVTRFPLRCVARRYSWREKKSIGWHEDLVHLSRAPHKVCCRNISWTAGGGPRGHIGAPQRTLWSCTNSFKRLREARLCGWRSLHDMDGRLPHQSATSARTYYSHFQLGRPHDSREPQKCAQYAMQYLRYGLATLGTWENHIDAHNTSVCIRRYAAGMDSTSLNDAREGAWRFDLRAATMLVAFRFVSQSSKLKAQSLCDNFKSYRTPIFCSTVTTSRFVYEFIHDGHEGQHGRQIENFKRQTQRIAFHSRIDSPCLQYYGTAFNTSRLHCIGTFWLSDCLTFTILFMSTCV